MSSHSNLTNFFRSPVRLLAVVSVLFLSSISVSKALTVDELAEHLGVKNWESTVAYPPGTFRVSVLKIVRGQIIPSSAPGYVGDKNDSNGRHLVIMISRTRGYLMGTLVVGDTTTDFDIDDDSAFGKAPNLSVSLPSKIKAGDYVLGGSLPNRKAAIRDIRQGLLLRIERVGPGA